MSTYPPTKTTTLGGRARAELPRPHASARTPTAHAETHATGGGDPVTPAAIGAVPTTRQVTAGQGLSGGGALSANVSLALAAFGGIVAKDHNPVAQNYAAGVTTLQTHDVTTHGQLLLLRVNLPARPAASIFARARIEFHDGSGQAIDNDNAAALERLAQDLVTDFMGGDTNPLNNGKAIQKVLFQVVNNTGGPSNQDFGNFGFRALAFPRGGGAAL